MQLNSLYIGTSGWSYKHWRGTFYPVDVKVKDEFQYYLSKFNSVEINNSFYRLPEEKTFQKWYDETPDNFVFVIKASRFITHMKKLHDPEQSTRLFFEHLRPLKEKLGVILFQLPPFLKKNLSLLKEFVEKLPTNNRYVFEFRNADWYSEDVYSILRQHNCAFCIYELDGHLSPKTITANFVYLRLHGPEGKYQGSYTDAQLEAWANECIEWLKSKDVFVYFDNDQSGFAAFNALKLKEIVNHYANGS